MPFVGEISVGAIKAEDVKTVLFAGQPDVPSRIIDRIYLLKEFALEMSAKVHARKKINCLKLSARVRSAFAKG